MKKTVIFDLDGTLLDSIEDIASSMNKVLESLKLPIHKIEDYKYFAISDWPNPIVLDHWLVFLPTDWLHQ